MSFILLGLNSVYLKFYGWNLCCGFENDTSLLILWFPVVLKAGFATQPRHYWWLPNGNIIYNQCYQCHLIISNHIFKKMAIKSCLESHTFTKNMQKKISVFCYFFTFFYFFSFVVLWCILIKHKNLWNQFKRKILRQIKNIVWQTNKEKKNTIKTAYHWNFVTFVVDK